MGSLSSQQIWICKPTDLSRGRGIYLLSGGEQLQKLDHKTIVQKYIANPLLINGYKWDLRLYCLVTSVNSLQVYMFEEGLVRFSSEKYSVSLQTLGNKFMHLTNTSVNKNAPNENKGNGSHVTKWTLRQLKAHFKDHGISFKKLFQEIEQILTLTLLTLSAECILGTSKRHSDESPPFFEFFGFDVMIDQNLRPWLLELNSPPQLHLDTETDNIVKPALTRDMILKVFHQRNKNANYANQA